MSRKSLAIFPLSLVFACSGVSAQHYMEAPKMAPPPALDPIEVGSGYKGEPGPKVRQDGKGSQLSAATTAYEIGDPTDEETLYLEFINRARADAAAEAVRLTNTANPNHADADPDVVSSADHVDFGVMATQFESLTQSTQPLAFNETLLRMARLHTQDQFNNVFQGHVSSSNPPQPFGAGFTLGDRADAVGGYNGGLGENVFSYAKSVWHGHAGFNIDWGTEGATPHGMQDPPGHRNNIHNASHREAGIGVHLGSNSNGGNSVGPQLVTQNMGSRFGTQFLTGVAFLDFNGDAFYSLGEGLGGITIEVEGQSFHAETTTSGAFAIPLPVAGGTYNVTVSGPNITTFTEAVEVPSSENFKMDYMPSFTPPAAGGTTTLTTGEAESYSFDSLPGVPNYRVRLAALDASGWTEGAEETPGQFTITQSAGYDMVQSSRVASGSKAFHFVHPSGIATEILLLDRDIIPSSTSSLTFQSRLGWSGTGQSAGVEVSTDGGTNWASIFSQAGTGGSTDSNFVAKTVDLSAYDGQVINLRFVYRFPGGSFFNQTDADTGWLVDDITVTNSSLIEASTTADFDTTSFSFTPPFDGDFSLEIAGVSGDRVFPYGPPVFLSSSGSGSTTGSLGDTLGGSGGTSTIVPAETAAEFFPDAQQDTGDGNWWFQSDLGLVHITNYPWVFHPKLGWMYLYGEAVDGFLVFIPGMGYCWTGVPGLYPYLYDVTNGKWLYFSEDFSTPTDRWFYDFSTPGWMSPDS